MNDTEQITIYAPNGGVYLSDGSTEDNTTFPLTDQCERSATLMGDDYVRLVFFSSKYVAFDAYSYIEYDGQTFFMSERYTPAANGEATLSNGEVQVGGYKYDCKFISVGNMLKKYTCYRHVVINASSELGTPRSEFDEPEINISGNLRTLYSIIITSIQRAVARIPDCHFRDMLQSLVTNCWDGSVNAPTSIVRLTEGDELDTYSFSGMNIADVCTQVCKSLTNNDHDTEWWIEEHHDTIEGLVLHMAKCQDTDTNGMLQLSSYWSENTGSDKNFRPYLSGGLTSCKYENEVSGIEQVVTPYGATRNMSALWTTGTDLVTNMIVTYGKRLRLDPNTTYKVYRKEDKATQNNPVYITTDEHGAIENDTVNTGIETSKFYDDIYPQCHFQITDVQVKEKHKSGVTYTVPEYTCMAEVVDSLNYDTKGNKIDRAWLAANGFYPIMIETGQTLSVRFESGFLNGREFEIANKTRKDEGAATYSMKFTIVATGSAENGDLIPSGNFRPQVGDQFALFNMKMPMEFITLAKQQLAQRAYEELVELQETRPAVKCKTEPYFFRNMSVHLGQLMKIESETFGKRVEYSKTAADNYIPYSNTFRDHVCISSKITNPLSYKTKRTVPEWECVQDATQVHAEDNIIFSFDSSTGVAITSGQYIFSIYVKNVGQNVTLQVGVNSMTIAAGFSGRVQIAVIALSFVTARFFASGDIDLVLWRMKLEKNSVATDWKPYSAYEYAPTFQSRCIAYSYKLTKPHEVDFKLASAVVQGVISSMQSAIADMNIAAAGLEQKTINLSRRGWHDAAEVADMLDSMQAEMMLVGNQLHQFQFESAISIINKKDGVRISYGRLEHTQEPFVTNSNRGIWYINDQNLTTDVDESPLDDNVAYYLYVECTEDTQTAVPMLVAQGSDTALNYADETVESGYPIHFLLGVLSSVFEDERVFNRTNGFTAIEGGTITTEVLQDANRNLIIDFVNGRIIARGTATISGNVVYKIEDDAQFQAALERILEAENFVRNLEIGGRNLLRDTAFTKAGTDLIGHSFYNPNSGSAGKTINGCSMTTANGKLTLAIRNPDIRYMLTQTGENAKGDTYTLSFECYADQACKLWFGAGYSSYAQYETITLGTNKKKYVITHEIKVNASTNPYRIFFIRFTDLDDNALDSVIDVHFSKMKLESGTVATDWTPAPEDAEEEIAAAQARADAAMQNLSDMANDNILTPQEKIDVRREYEEIVAEFTQNEAQGIKYGIIDPQNIYARYNSGALALSACNAYLKAYITVREMLVGGRTNTLGLIGAGGAVTNQYMQTTSPLNNLTFNGSTITFTGTFKTFYEENVKLLNAISDVINSRAGESGQNLIGEENPLTLSATGADATNDYYYKCIVGNATELGWSNISRHKAVNPDFLVNGREYTFCVDKVERLAGTTTQFTILLHNGSSSTQRYDLDVKSGRQTCKITVPSDGKDYVVLLYAGLQGATAGNSLRFTNLALYEGSHSAEFYKEYIKHLTDALQGTTETRGGMVMTNVLMLKNEDGNVTAGMSGLTGDSATPENVFLWADPNASKGSYGNALAQSKRDVTEIGKNDITTLIKKDGTAKIGVFSIDQSKARVKVYNGDTVTGIVDIDAENGMKIYKGSSATDANLKIFITPNSVMNDTWKPRSKVSISKDGFVSSGTNNSATNSSVHVATGEFTLSSKSNYLKIVATSAYGSIHHVDYNGTNTKTTTVSVILQIKTGSTWNDHSTICTRTETAAGSYSSTDMWVDASTGGTKTLSNITAGTYRVVLKVSGSPNYSQYTYSLQKVECSGWYLPSYSEKTIIGIDGLISAKDSTHCFIVDNSGSAQKIIARGLSTTNTDAEDGELYISSNFIESFKALCTELKSSFEDVRFVGSNGDHANAIAAKLESVKNSLTVTKIIATS
ncbi:MAG: hypothetical protein IJS13_07110 [Paludibacteraceae bacterium]|nr:hypothetical protein [Paludibacteraceae bacterium]